MVERESQTESSAHGVPHVDGVVTSDFGDSACGLSEVEPYVARSAVPRQVDANYVGVLGEERDDLLPRGKGLREPVHEHNAITCPTPTGPAPAVCYVVEHATMFS